MAIIALSVVPLLLTGPAAAWLYIALLKRGGLAWRWLFWPLLGIAAAAGGALIAHTFGGLFPGAGCFATLFSPASAVLTLLVFRLGSKRFTAAVGEDAIRQRSFQSAMLILAMLQLSTPLIGLVYARSCDLLNRRAARPIIAALERYREEYGRYPMPPGRHRSDLTILIPRYLDAVPRRVCRAPWGGFDAYAGDDDWSLYFCTNSPGQETLLLVPVIGTDTRQIYNAETGLWSRGNSLDGFCP
jgi:hypothetical protein